MASNQQSAAKSSRVADDPRAASVARVYAHAFLGAAGTGAEAAVAEYREFVDQVLAEVPDLGRLLSSVTLSVDDLLGIIDRVVAPQASPLFANFLRVLARHRRLGLLANILSVTTKEAERRAGKRRVQIRTAAPLSEETARELSAKLAAAIAAEPILETAVDPSILGGLIVRVGDTVYDGSVRTRLKQLSSRMRERYLHEIQRGRDRFCHSEGN